MRLRLVVILMLSAMTAMAHVGYEPDMFEFIVNDIYEQLAEEGMRVDMEELTVELTELSERKINLNTATEEELQKLRFLNAEQIDAILGFVYKQPMHSLYELRLTGVLTDYEIRNMLPFVYVADVAEKEPFYVREMFHYGRHEADIRFDARSIESNGKDPFYGSLRYRFSYLKKVDAGVVAERDAGEPLYRRGKTYGADFYGGWLRVDDVWKLKRVVAGDYRASFGEGLVLNTGLNYGGKAQYLQNSGVKEEGLRSKTSMAEYDFLRGVGATANFGKVTVTALYSARKIDGKVVDGVFPTIQRTGYHRTDSETGSKRAVWQQIVGVNVGLKLKRLRLGITAMENMLGDTLRVRKNYYNQNFFEGKRQFAAGMNYNWQIRRVHLFGEVATAQNTTFGVANITGVRYMPINGVTLSGIYRYYSRYYDNMLGSSLQESTRLNDEQAVYAGIDVRIWKNWRLWGYADFFFFKYAKYGIKEPSWGFDTYLSAEYRQSERLSMQWSAKVKQKGDMLKGTVRYGVATRAGNWIVKTYAEGNMVKRKAEMITLGGMVYVQAEYHANIVPLVVQARVEGFYTASYDNRIYNYENDVLYAFMMPMIYGTGGRWYVNFRYRINDSVSIYLKGSQTVFSDETMEKQGLQSRTRSEVHTMLRLRF